MTTFQSHSSLIEDVYLHGPVSAQARVTVTPDRSGDLQIFSVGTDNHLYTFSPDPSSETGWQQTDLGSPGSITVFPTPHREN